MDSEICTENNVLKLHEDRAHVGNVHFVPKCQKMMRLQASVYLGILTGMHISRGMSTDIPLCVNVCS